MANIKINITELKALLDITPPDQNLMLVGNHGIGKSEILTQYFTEKGVKVVALFLGQMSDPGDLIGLPNKDEKTGKTDFLPPYWFPIDGKPIVLFLDELNRARPEVLQTIMDLALNRKLAGRSLPKGSRIISAINEGEQYQLTDLDPALVSRFNIVSFRPSVQEWLLWADKEGLDYRISSFIRENPIWLDRDPDIKENSDTGLDKTPDRRAWKRVSDILKNQPELSNLVIKAISSIVGIKAASAFIESAAKGKVLSGEEILLYFSKHSVKLTNYEPHKLAVANDSVYRYLEVENIRGEKKDTVKKNIVAYFDFLSNNRKESAAHFASLFVQKTYKNAVAFLACECPDLVSKLVKYIKDIH